MSAEQKNNIFWWAKLVSIVLAIITMIGILSGGVVFVTNMVARTEILQSNQEYIAKTQQSVLTRLNDNDMWKHNRAVADTMLTVNMRWMYEKIVVHEKRLNRVDLAHKFNPFEYDKQ
jgi:hypothetical protein